MSGSKLVGTSSSTRTLDERDLAALRPAVERPRIVKVRRREPVDGSRSFFCSNANCDHATWTPAKQAVHMAQEFRWAVQAIAKLAPESEEALRLTGGVILRDMTDDDCRAAKALRQQYRNRGEEEPMELMLRANEYERRRLRGDLQPLPEDEQRRRKIEGPKRWSAETYGQVSDRVALLPSREDCVALRQARRLTQTAVGRSIGGGRHAVMKWEALGRPLSLNLIDGYLSALGLNASAWREADEVERKAMVAEATAGGSRKRPMPLQETCQRGHNDWVAKGDRRVCRTCRNASNRRSQEHKRQPR